MTNTTRCQECGWLHGADEGHMPTPERLWQYMEVANRALGRMANGLGLIGEEGRIASEGVAKITDGIAHVSDGLDEMTGALAEVVTLPDNDGQ